MARELVEKMFPHLRPRTRRSFVVPGLIVIVILAIILYIVARPKPNQTAQTPQPRDEFIEKLVSETNDIFPLLTQGRKYYSQGEFERAQKLFKKAAGINRDYRDSFYLLGVTELQLGHTDQALYALIRAKTIDPIYKPTYESLIDIYRQKGDLAKTEDLKAKAQSL